jgi:hypothetical protein
VRRVQWGGPGNIPVPGDDLGPGCAQVAVCLPSTGEWLVRRETGIATRVPWGAPGDVPVPRDYQGIGRTQLAVFRPVTREWFVRGPDGSTTRIPWGAGAREAGGGGRPVPACCAPQFGMRVA